MIILNFYNDLGTISIISQKTTFCLELTYFLNYTESEKK